MKKVNRTSPGRLARHLGTPKSRGLEAVLKAQLIAAIVRRLVTVDSPTRTWPVAPVFLEAQ